MDLNDESFPDTHRTWLKQRLVNIDQSQGVTLTDNLSSLEHLQIRKSEHYRRMIVDLFGTSHFIR